MIKLPFENYLQYNGLHIEIELWDSTTGEMLYRGKDKQALQQYNDRDVIKLIGAGAKFIFILG